MSLNEYNGCYEPDCENPKCHDPKHFNYICLNPDCSKVKCQIKVHYDNNIFNRQIRESASNITDEKTEHNPDHHCYDDSCCDDESLCNCGSCENKSEDLFSDKHLIQNRSIQIIIGSITLFSIGYILDLIRPSMNNITPFIFLVVVIISGYDVIVGGIKQLFNKKVTMGFLIGLAVLCSLLIGHAEEAAAVTMLFFISEFLENYAEERAQNSIKSLIEIAPDTALIKQNNVEKIVNISEINIGDIVIVKPGDRIPLDGIVSKGVSSVNQAPITGESVPVVKNIKNEVFAGTINQEGYLEIKVTKKSTDSVISKIIKLVEDSRLNRSSTEKFIDKFSKYYTPIIIVVAIFVAIIPSIILNQPIMTWVYRALVMMVVSCPCAFVISTPVSMVSAITSATRQGVLIKGRDYIEEMKEVKAVVFDKTGTLTEGKLEVGPVDIINKSYSEDQLIEIASSLEIKSNHPIAKAIVNYANTNSINLSEIKNFKNVPGKGIVGFIGDNEYYAANESLINNSEFNISVEDFKNYATEGKTVVVVGDKFSIIGIITVLDKIRDESSKVISKLNDMGIQTVMLTGDNKTSAQKVADGLNIKYTYSNLLPDDKLSIIDIIRNKFGDVAMIGDGINDAPALSRANVGIAMGAIGSDVAIETADIALMQDDLTKVPYLFDLSHKTMSIIKQNVYTAISVKSIFAILAVFGIISLWVAVGIGDMGLTLLVILNSFRLASSNI